MAAAAMVRDRKITKISTAVGAILTKFGGVIYFNNSWPLRLLKTDISKMMMAAAILNNKKSPFVGRDWRDLV